MAKIVAYPVLVLSAIGVSLCFGFCLLGVTGIYPLPSRTESILFGGIFVVWVPTVILMNKLTEDFKQKDLWKAALRGCPPWMKTALWVVIGSVFIFFFVSVVSGHPDQIFVLFPIAFYSTSFGVMYSLINVDKFDSTRRCLNGHRISPLAKFCEECGASAAPSNLSS